MGDEETICFFRQRIQLAVGQEGKMLTDVIHNLERIIGKQNRKGMFRTGEEAKNSFYYVFFRFMRAICSNRHTIVLLLDDTHWADEDSVKLLNMLVNKKSIKHLLFICAYREEEASNAVVLRDNEVIKITNLDFDDVHSIITDVLKRAKSDTLPLAAFVHEKTKGNAFFVMQVLLQFKEEGLIYFCRNQYIWTWNACRLEGFSVSDHVIPLLVNKISKLCNDKINLLKILSCIGSHFHRSIIELFARDNEIIKGVVKDGFIIARASDAGTDNYRFSHDYMQQAIDSLINEDERKFMCLQIGKNIWDKSSSKERSENLFIVTNLLNSSIDLVSDVHEQKKIMRLNFLSGQRGKKSGAFQTAYDYLTSAMNLLQGNHWEQDYDFTLKLLTTTAAVAYCIANYTAMDQIIANIMSNAKCALHKIECYSLQIRAYCEQRMLQKLVKCGLSGLESYGEQLSLIPITDIVHEIEEIKRYLWEHNFNVKSLLEIQNEHKLAALRILQELALMFYLYQPKFYPIIISKFHLYESLSNILIINSPITLIANIARMMQITINHGSSIFTPSVLVKFSTILCIYLEDKTEIIKYKEAALMVLSRSNEKHQMPSVYLIIYSLLDHWIEHISHTIEPLQTA